MTLSIEFIRLRKSLYTFVVLSFAFPLYNFVFVRVFFASSFLNTAHGLKRQKNTADASFATSSSLSLSMFSQWLVECCRETSVVIGRGRRRGHAVARNMNRIVGEDLTVATRRRVMLISSITCNDARCLISCCS